MTNTEITPQEELYHIQESTNDDGTVQVEILEWAKVDSRVRIKFQLPTVETTNEWMPWPDKDSDEFKFVRLVRECGYDLASAEQIVGERVKSDGDELLIPKSKTTAEKAIVIYDLTFGKVSISGKLWWIIVFSTWFSHSIGTAWLLLKSDALPNVMPYPSALPYAIVSIVILAVSGLFLLMALTEDPDDM